MPKADTKKAVGLERDYKLAGAIQLNNLIQVGMRPEHTLCDFGCGSLRLGMYAMQYLNRGNYYGIEPEKKLVMTGIVKNHLLQLSEAKKFNIHFSNKCDIGVFEIEFDYIIAQSVFTHFPVSAIKKTLKSAYKSMHNNSIFLVTIWESNKNYPGKKWCDTCVPYAPGFFIETCNRENLTAKKVYLPHWNKLSWYMITRS
jgi:hypothetical protein